MRRQTMIAVALTLGAGATHAMNECGAPEAGKEIVCSPASYDADTDGNIVYFPTGTTTGEVRVRLTEDLTVRYDRADPDDDQTVFPDDGEPMPTAVRIETAAEHTGNVTVHSAADIVSNARGLSVAHYGRSGSIRTEVDGGTYQKDQCARLSLLTRGDEVGDAVGIKHKTPERLPWREDANAERPGAFAHPCSVYEFLMSVGAKTHGFPPSRE